MTEAICQWLSFKLKDNNPNVSLIYISNIYSHEDKPSCLKIDLWMAILRHSLTNPENHRHLQLERIAEQIVEQLSTTNFSTWKFKYQAWMFDSVITYLDSNTQIVETVVASITKQTLASHHMLSSFLSSFISYTAQKDMSKHILHL
jgi:hypothetical protein